MKYTILHLVTDYNIGGVTTSINSQIQSYLGDKFNFVLCSPTELLEQRKNLKPDLIIVNDACAWRFLPTLLQLRWLGKLIIQEHHYSADFETYKVSVKWRFRLMLRLAYKLASQVIAVSDAQGKWMIQHRLLEPTKLTVIPQCRVLDDFLGLSPKLLGQKLILGAYGRFSTQKGFDILLQAMQSLPNLDIELHVGGYGEDETWLRQLAKDDSRIQFMGKLSNVPKFLETCDLVIIPSRWEPWGNAFLEAKAASKPVIVTNVDGLVEQVVDCGLVVEPNVLSLADAIARVADIHRNSPQILLNWGSNSRENVRGDWESYLTQWDALLWQLCHG